MSDKNYQIGINNGKLFVEEKEIVTQHPVVDAFQEKDKIVILLDPDSYRSKFGQFPNLIAVRENGQRVWTAQLPTAESGDRYYRISSTNPLIAYSVRSYSCEIDTTTG